MTLEERVEALEKQVDLLSNGPFIVEAGKVHISNAIIRNGEINAAIYSTARISAQELSGNTPVFAGVITASRQ